jgi:hypothetical protein
LQTISKLQKSEVEEKRFYANDAFQAEDDPSKLEHGDQNELEITVLIAILHSAIKLN